MGSNVRRATPVVQIGIFFVAAVLVLPWVAQSGVAGLAAYLLAGALGVWGAEWYSGPEDRLGAAGRKHLVLIGWPVFAAVGAFQAFLEIAAGRSAPVPAAKAVVVAVPATTASPAPQLAPKPVVAPAAEAAQAAVAPSAPPPTPKLAPAAVPAPTQAAAIVPPPAPKPAPAAKPAPVQTAHAPVAAQPAAVAAAPSRQAPAGKPAAGSRGKSGKPKRGK